MQTTLYYRLLRRRRHQPGRPQVRHPGREAGAGLADGGLGPDAGRLVEVVVRGRRRPRGRDAAQGLLVLPGHISLPGHSSMTWSQQCRMDNWLQTVRV